MTLTVNFQRWLIWSKPLRLFQFVVAMGIFCYAALSPSPQLIGQHSDSSLHFVGNVLLFLSAWVAFWGRIALWKLLLVLLPFSGAIEFAQHFSPGRQVDMKDLGVNVAGLASGLIIAAFVNAIVKRILR